MGGGDLNLKKSWHPQTMKNQERVWKAEQAKSEEQKRLNELRKEIDEERNREEIRRIGESSGVLAKTDSDKKLEWMYKSSSELINREEYLLGRAIDKSFETLQAEEKRKDANTVGVKQPLNHVEHECIPFSIREYRSLESTEQVDLQRKVLEDPLMLIKQREMESRRKLLENPVKLKELHRILKTDKFLDKSKQSKKSKKVKKSKKSKKHKKRSKSTSSSSSANSGDIQNREKDLDAELAKKYKKIKGSIFDTEGELKNLSLSKLLDAKYDTISKELDKAVESKRKPKKGTERRGYSNSEGSEDNERQPRHGQQNRKGDYNQINRRSRSREKIQRRRRSHSQSPIHQQSFRRPDKYSRRSRTRSRSRSPVQQQRRVNYKNNRRSRSHSPRNAKRQDARRQSPPASSRGSKLSEAEKEARRREMMENAAWRETDRTQVVKKHREAYEIEEKQNKNREFDKDFINKEVKKAIANQSSVGSRIRSNLNNIQRKTSSMNSNFARK